MKKWSSASTATKYVSTSPPSEVHVSHSELAHDEAGKGHIEGGTGEASAAAPPLPAVASGEGWFKVGGESSPLGLAPSWALPPHACSNAEPATTSRSVVLAAIGRDDMWPEVRSRPSHLQDVR